MAFQRFGPKEEVGVLKSVGSSVDFLDRGKVRAAIKNDACLLMGHTRWATVGKVTSVNAQPFLFDNIVGCHNGTLGGGAKWRLEGKDQNLGTDSAALYWHLQKYGFDSMLSKVEKADAMALTWYDAKTREMHFYRNEHRPLWYAIDETNSTVYWASESGMLYLVLNRQGIKFNKITQLPVNQHMRFILPDKKEVRFQKPVARFRAASYANTAVQAGSGGRVFTSVANQGGSSASGAGNNVVPFVPSGTNATGTSSNATTTGCQSNTDLVQAALARMEHNTGRGSFVSDDKFRMSRLINRATKDGGAVYRSMKRDYEMVDFEKKMFEGCAICGCAPVWGEPVKFLKDESFCCASCITEAKENNSGNNPLLMLLENLL